MEPWLTKHFKGNGKYVGDIKVSLYRDSINSYICYHWGNECCLLYQRLCDIEVHFKLQFHLNTMVNLKVSFNYGIKCGGLILCVLDSAKLSGPGLSPDWRIAKLHSWARHFTLTVPLFIQVYKWVLTNVMLGVTLSWTGFPRRERRNTPSHFMLRKLE